jgi:hypothetical protein
VTDRELLELAAKAAGIVLEWQDGGWEHSLDTGREWNSLTDDGDALRLAVKLSIDVTHGDLVVVAERVGPVEVGVAESKVADPCAAVRLAITRAAAEIGRGMK